MSRRSALLRRLCCDFARLMSCGWVDGLGARPKAIGEGCRISRTHTAVADGQIDVGPFLTHPVPLVVDIGGRSLLR